MPTPYRRPSRSSITNLPRCLIRTIRKRVRAAGVTRVVGTATPLLPCPVAIVGAMVRYCGHETTNHDHQEAHFCEAEWPPTGALRDIRSALPAQREPENQIDRRCSIEDFLGITAWLWHAYPPVIRESSLYTWALHGKEMASGFFAVISVPSRLCVRPFPVGRPVQHRTGTEKGTSLECH